MRSRSSLLEFSSSDEVQRWAVEAVLSDGTSVSPRGQHTIEISPASFTLLRPRNRRVIQPERKWSFALAIGEFLWHASASDDASVLEYYAHAWGSFAVEGRIRGSCYGKSIFSRRKRSLSQWENVLRLLESDPCSRRAVLDFRVTDSENELSAPDIACASTLQFLIRDNQLNALTVMRSNDVVWGLPYDIFLFTMIQEMAAQTLGLELGWYHHHAASLHIYDRHLNLAQAILSAKVPDARHMGVMGSLDDLPKVIEQERRLRQGFAPDVAQISSRYWVKMIEVLSDFRQRKRAA
jgi:thymidylate synthase